MNWKTEPTNKQINFEVRFQDGANQLSLLHIYMYILYTERRVQIVYQILIDVMHHSNTLHKIYLNGIKFYQARCPKNARTRNRQKHSENGKKLNRNKKKVALRVDRICTIYYPL